MCWWQNRSFYVCDNGNRIREVTECVLEILHLKEKNLIDHLLTRTGCQHCTRHFCTNDFILTTYQGDRGKIGDAKLIGTVRAWTFRIIFSAFKFLIL